MTHFSLSISGQVLADPRRKLELLTSLLIQAGIEHRTIVRTMLILTSVYGVLLFFPTGMPVAPSHDPLSTHRSEPRIMALTLVHSPPISWHEG